MSIHIDDFSGRRVHMVGIGGSSMSGLAGLIARRGCIVTGSDNYESYAIAKLRAAGIPVSIGHDAARVTGAALLIYSAAIAPDNPERAEAARLGIPQMERSTLLGQLMQGAAQAIAIAGTHGKTTATAMLAQALVAAGLDPSVHLGGSFDAIGGGTRVGGGGVFLAEACEFHGSFLELRPTVAVVLNIQEDHLDWYRDLAHIAEAFAEFAALLPPDGVLLVNGDDPLARALKAPCPTLTYGLGEGNDWRAARVTYDDYGNGRFDATLRGDFVAHVDLRVGGDFNVGNALAALAAAVAVGGDPALSAAALSAFAGVHRRLEHTGVVDGVRLYHDYGHNPVEMAGALSVMKKQPHGRLWAVMQPHTYSRVKRLFDGYVTCCADADEILVTDIYAAREADPGDIHSQMLVDAIAATGQRVHLTPTFADTEAYLRAHWRPGDLVLTMGCGNINELNDLIAAHGDAGVTGP